MKMPQAIIDRKRLRQIRGRLAACGLVHWLPVLTNWVSHYAGIEDIVDDERDGPLAAVLLLLRQMARLDARPSDAAFARLLSSLEFLRYRVRRSAEQPPTFEEGETWLPEEGALADWRRGYAIGGWRALVPPVNPALVVRHLLSEARAARNAGGLG